MGDRYCTKRSALAMAVLVLGGGVGACYPGEINDVGEADLVVTLYDTTYAFGDVNTYIMPDSIVRIGEGDEDDIDRDYDDEILLSVAAELNALGWTRLPDSPVAQPDVAVTISISSSTFTYWVPGGWWGYWGWYPWYPSWGWGCCYYPSYPWYGYGGSYSTGTLSIVMLDGGPAVGEEIPAVWAGLMNGLLSSTTSATAARVDQLIEQTFSQSPYLGG